MKLSEKKINKTSQNFQQREKKLIRVAIKSRQKSRQRGYQICREISPRKGVTVK